MAEREGKKEEREALVPLRREARMNPEERKGEKQNGSFFRAFFSFLPISRSLLVLALLSSVLQKIEAILPLPPPPREKPF